MMPDDWEGHPLAEGLPDHGVCGINDMSTITTGVTSEADVRRDAATHQDSAGHRTMVLNMGPAAPVDARCAPPVAGTGRRNYRQSRSGYRLPAHRHRKGIRSQDLSAGRHADGPHRLPRAASNNLVYCLAAEKLLGLEIPELAQFTPRDAGGIHPPEQPPGVACDARHRHRRNERLPLLLPGTRRDPPYLRDVSPVSA